MLICCSHVAAISLKEHLAECLQDKDYDVLMETVKKGLPHINDSNHVVIVGAGMAGLTAAKLLQDAGHRVNVTQFIILIYFFPFSDGLMNNNSNPSFPLAA